MRDPGGPLWSVVFCEVKALTLRGHLDSLIIATASDENVGC